MGILSETVSFEGSLPTAAAFVAALRQHTGEAVLFDEETELLSCAAIGNDVAFWALVYEPDRSWTLRNLNLTGDYLYFASFAVLQLLGGKRNAALFTQPPALPAWAYKSWRLAKQEYKQRRVLWLTHEEACQQGLGQSIS